MLPNKVYDVLKWVAILFLPALAVLIKNVFPIWGIPYGEQIYETLIEFEVFLGTILGISAISYIKKGGKK